MLFRRRERKNCFHSLSQTHTHGVHIYCRNENCIFRMNKRVKKNLCHFQRNGFSLVCSFVASTFGLYLFGCMK